MPNSIETARAPGALEQMPPGRDDWKPHQKSMPLARLAGLVASMPSWVSLIIDQDELDLNPPSGGGGLRFIGPLSEQTSVPS